MKITTVATALLLALAPTITCAQTVYRCGPDGRIYADRPCTEGRAVEVADARDAAQRREARSTAAAQRQLAQDLTAQRLAREQAALSQGGGAAGFERPKAVEFTSPSTVAATPRRHGPRKPAKRIQPHTGWQATSPAQPR